MKKDRRGLLVNYFNRIQPEIITIYYECRGYVWRYMETESALEEQRRRSARIFITLDDWVTVKYQGRKRKEEGDGCGK